MDWNGIWESIKEFFTSNGWNILKFFAVLFFGIIFIKILINVTRKVLVKVKVPKMTSQFLILLFKFILYLILVLILMSIVGIQVSGLLTAFSAIILAIGVALESNISNFANGIVLISTGMFNSGDYISIYDDVEGIIVNINFLFTTINTTDNKRITVPNSKLVNNSVSNYSAYPQRRVNMNFAVAYDSDIELVKKVITDVMKSNGKVYLDKPILCRLKTIEDSHLNFYGYCWCDTSDYWDVYYYLQENVYNEFKRNNIVVPYSQVEVRNRVDTPKVHITGNSLPKRVEKERKDNGHGFDLETADLTKIFNPNTYKKRRKKKNKNNQNSQNNQSNLGAKSSDVKVNIEKTTEVNANLTETTKVQVLNNEKNVKPNETSEQKTENLKSSNDDLKK